MDRRAAGGAIAVLASTLCLGLLVAPAASAEEPAPIPAQGSTDQIIVTTLSASITASTIEQETQEAATALGLDVDAAAGPRVTRVSRVIKLSADISLSDAEVLADQLATSPGIVTATPDVRIRPAVTLPNDPYTSSQWGLWQSAPANGGFSSRAPAAWDRSTGAGTVVAVLDTGIVAHPDLDAHVVAGYDFIVDTFVANDGDARDGNAADPGDWITAAEEIANGYDIYGDPYCPRTNSTWHGTHVAGTIGAVTDNSLGVAGIAPDVRIQPVRVLGKCGGYMSDIAAGITWASGGSVPGVPANSTPADVINMSLGGYSLTGCDATTQSAIDGAVARGTTVVVAAGNDGLDVTYGRSQTWPQAGFVPATCNNVVTVASHTSTGARSWFSNYGALVEISGPGSGVWSTLDSGATSPAGATYASYSGTSMATPHVAGSAALLMAADPSLSPADVTATLQATAQAFAAGSSCINACGSGYVDAAAAVTSVAVGPPSTPAITPAVEVLAVTWSAPQGIAPAYYDVERSDDSITWVADDTVTGTSATIDGLTGGVPYWVRVRSVTADDSSAWVIAGPAVPLAPTAPGAPTGIGIVVNDASLSVTWSAPAQTGGRPILHYEVATSTDDSTWVADDTVTGTSATIDGLVNGTSYRVRIRAVNAIDAGPAALSALAAPRVPAAPTAPRNTGTSAGDGTLTVTWSAPEDDGGRAIASYVVQTSTDDSTWTSRGTVVGLTTTITGLTNGQAYSVRIAATNTIGTGAWAMTSGTPVAPPPPAPAPPPAPVITAPGAPIVTEVGVDDRMVMALWQPSDDTGGEAPGEYVVELSGPADTQTLTTTIPYAEFDSLVNGATYRVRVAAANSAGTGDFSAWSEPLVPIGPAAAPTGLTGTAGDGTVDLSWSPPLDSGGGPIDGYVVTWTSAGVEVSMTTDDTAIRLGALANGTRYEFRVAAENETGTGAWSDPLALTPRAAPVTAPRDVTITRSGLRLIVTWASPDIGEPRRYVVAASVNGSAYRVKKSTTTTRVVLGITKRTTTVAVRVLAVDSYGRGPWSSPTQIRLPARQR